MKIALYNPGRIYRWVAKLLKGIGAVVYEWEANKLRVGGETVGFPGSDQYVPLMERSRVDLDRFFSSVFDASMHRPADIYFRKKYDIQYLDYYAFREQLASRDDLANGCLVLGGGYNRRIYEKKAGSILGYLRLPLVVLLNSWSLLFYTFKTYVAAALYGGDERACEIIYLRKKAYPDLGMKDKLAAHLAKKGCQSVGAVAVYSSARERYGFTFLNAFSGAKQRSLANGIAELGEIYAISLLQVKNGLSGADIHGYIKNIFLARSVVSLNSKVIVGVLVDKPLFTLLSAYKRPDQMIMGINESFFYPPFRSFDYNLLDAYFCMNEIDSALQNRYGGEIKQHVPVEFIRKSLESTSEGISDELATLIKRYNRVAVATAMQVSETGFTQWGRKEVNDFVAGVVEIARQNPDDLVILKGKKNELSHLNASLESELESLENLFVIHSTRPRYLKNDQFEDLLAVADVVISMSHTSTTIWQAIAENIPVIAINDAHPPSFLSEYEQMETRSEQAAGAYRHWMAMAEADLEQFLRQLKQRVNLGDSNGLRQIADYIAGQVR